MGLMPNGSKALLSKSGPGSGQGAATKRATQKPAIFGHEDELLAGVGARRKRRSKRGKAEAAEVRTQAEEMVTASPGQSPRQSPRRGVEVVEVSMGKRLELLLDAQLSTRVASWPSRRAAAKKPVPARRVRFSAEVETLLFVPRAADYRIDDDSCEEDEDDYQEEGDECFVEEDDELSMEEVASDEEEWEEEQPAHGEQREQRVQGELRCWREDAPSPWREAAAEQHREPREEPQTPAEHPNEGGHAGVRKNMFVPSQRRRLNLKLAEPLPDETNSRHLGNSNRWREKAVEMSLVADRIRGGTQQEQKEENEQHWKPWVPPVWGDPSPRPEATGLELACLGGHAGISKPGMDRLPALADLGGTPRLQDDCPEALEGRCAGAGEEEGPCEPASSSSRPPWKEGLFELSPGRCAGAGEEEGRCNLAVAALAARRHGRGGPWGRAANCAWRRKARLLELAPASEVAMGKARSEVALASPAVASTLQEAAEEEEEEEEEEQDFEVEDWRAPIERIFRPARARRLRRPHKHAHGCGDTRPRPDVAPMGHLEFQRQLALCRLARQPPALTRPRSASEWPSQLWQQENVAEEGPPDCAGWLQSFLSGGATPEQAKDRCEPDEALLRGHLNVTPRPGRVVHGSVPSGHDIGRWFMEAIAQHLRHGGLLVDEMCQASPGRWMEQSLWLRMGSGVGSVAMQLLASRGWRTERSQGGSAAPAAERRSGRLGFEAEPAATSAEAYRIDFELRFLSGPRADVERSMLEVWERLCQVGAKPSEARELRFFDRFDLDGEIQADLPGGSEPDSGCEFVDSDENDWVDSDEATVEDSDEEPRQEAHEHIGAAVQEMRDPAGLLQLLPAPPGDTIGRGRGSQERRRLGRELRGLPQEAGRGS